MFETSDWRKRLPDSPLFTLPQISETCAARYAASRGSSVRLSSLRFDAKYGDLRLPGGDGSQRSIWPTNWAVSQLALLVDFPWSYLATLRQDLAAECINNSLAILPQEQNAVMVWTLGEPGAIRRFTPPDKTYNWDTEVVNLLMASLPPALQKVAWARISDRNLFVCLTSGQEVADGYERGLLLWSSEVGQMPTGMRAVLVNPTLGETIPNVACRLFKGKEKVERIDAALRREVSALATSYLRASPEAEQAIINGAKSFYPTQPIDWLASNGLLKQAVHIISLSLDRSAWGLAKTAAAQSQILFSWADERSAFDAKIGRLLEV